MADMAGKAEDIAEEEVWQTLRALNDAWTKGDPADPEENT